MPMYFVQFKSPHFGGFVANILKGTLRALSIMSKTPEISIRPKSDEKKSFGSFRPKYSGSPLKVVPIFPSAVSDRNLPFHFDKRVHCATSLHLRKEFGKGIKNGVSSLIEKMSFHFPRV